MVAEDAMHDSAEMARGTIAWKDHEDLLGYGSSDDSRRGPGNRALKGRQGRTGGHISSGPDTVLDFRSEETHDRSEKVRLY